MQLIRVRLVLVNLNPINDTYTYTLAGIRVKECVVQDTTHQMSVWYSHTLFGCVGNATRRCPIVDNTLALEKGGYLQVDSTECRCPVDSAESVSGWR